MAERICIIDGCERPFRARGWCATHWLRWRKHGDPMVTLHPGQGPCAVPDCDRISTSRGWCATHYTRWQRHGDPTKTLREFGTVMDLRFMGFVEQHSEGCWLWQGALTVNGYGVFNSEMRTKQAHRWSYARWVGPLVPGLEIDHLCRVRCCVNPQHLEQVTHAENMRRARGPRGPRRSKVSDLRVTVTA